MDAAQRRTALQAGGLLVAGAVAGGVLAATVGASASSPGTTAPSPASYAAGPGAPMGPHRGLPLTGTVTSVGTDSVTIQTSSGSKTYAVDAQSDIDKNGEAQLSDLKALDKVRFAVRPGTSTIAVLHAGDEAKDRPMPGAGDSRGPEGMGRHGFGPGGPMGAHRGLPLTGTVTSVGTDSVTIQTSSGSKTYAVDAQSDIDKNGEAQLSDLKALDKVRFAVRPGTSTIAVLHAGDEAKDRPAPGAGPHGAGPWGPGPGGAVRPPSPPTTSG